MKRSISITAEVHADASNPEYGIGDRVVYCGSEATVIGLLYNEMDGMHPEWNCMIRFDNGDRVNAWEADLSTIAEYEEYDRCEA